MIGYIIAGAVIILVIAVLFSGYKKAPPDTAFIISGLRKKIIIGKASVKLPFFERMDKPMRSPQRIISISRWMRR